MINFRKDAPTSITYGTHKLGNSLYDSIKVSSIKVHPNYDDSNANNDIAVLTLESEVKESDNVKIIPLGTNKIASGNIVQIFGWGQTSGFKITQPSDLQTTNLTTWSNYRCYLYTGKSNVISASSSKQIACKVS